MAGLDAADAGVVDLDGTPVAEVDQRCAVAFQEPRLLPWRTHRAQRANSDCPRGTDRAAGRARVAELLRLVQLTEAATLRPRQVSGGMAQRASLARALARGPGILLLDEPFGALDALTRLTMQDLLLDIHAAEPATILLVTHDVDEALALADRVVLLGEDPERPGEGATIRADARRCRVRARATAPTPSWRLLRGDLLERLGVDSHRARAAPERRAASTHSDPHLTCRSLTAKEPTPMKKPLAALAALAVTATLALTGCVAGEDTPAEAPNRAADGWSADHLNIDFATYNPLSLIIKDQGWLEDALGDDVTVTWTQSAGSNKANEALRAGAIDVGSTAGSAALLARSNGSPIQVIDIYSQPNWAAIVVPADSPITDVARPEGRAHRRDQGHRPVLLPAADAGGGGHRPRRGHHREPAARRRQDRARVRCRRRLVGPRPAAVDERRDRRVDVIYDNIDFNSYGFLNATEDVPRRQPRPRPGGRERLREGARLGDRQPGGGGRHPRRGRRRSTPRSRPRC